MRLFHQRRFTIPATTPISTTTIIPKTTNILESEKYIKQKPEETVFNAARLNEENYALNTGYIYTFKNFN